MEEISLSNESFWPWVSKLIENQDTEYFNFVSRMIDAKRYVALNTTDPISDFKIFRYLKTVMPLSYFREMEYCALAYSSAFGKIFPPLAKHIEQLAYIEWLCYIEPENPDYRDHFVHMLKVAFVCQTIISINIELKTNISSWQFDSEHFRNWCEKERIYFNNSEKSNILSIAIFLASIFHDFGYGYNFLRRYEERLFKLNLLGCDSIDITKKRAEIIKKSLLGEFIFTHHEWFDNNKTPSPCQKESTILGFIHDCLPLNHSIASSLLVLDIADDLFHSQIISSELYIAFQIAAEACLLHDLTNPHKYIHFSHISDSHKHFLDSNCHTKVPIAILLIFADEISMWSRPLIQFVPNGNDKLGVEIHHQWKNTKHSEVRYPKTIKLSFQNTPSELKIQLENTSQKDIFDEVLRECYCFSDDKNKTLKILDYEIKFN